VGQERACLSVVVPCYNEENTVASLIDRVLASPWTAEVVVVNDGSTDGSAKVLDDLLSQPGYEKVRVFDQGHNQGKGFALKRGFAEATADFVIVQDADLEYDPADWPVLLEPIVDGRADAVFGSRFLGGPHRVLYFWHSVGNWVLTTVSNMFTNLNLTDMETCYKAMRGEVARSLLPKLTANRFGFEPEITARLAKAGARVYEVPISYSGRTYAEGKKIGWKDGVAAMWHIVKYNLLVR
jgi:glycosyltransferase involved in cell wall biosynthesis